MLLLIECMRDAEVNWPERIKAAQGVLNAGLPKDPDAVEKFFGDSGAATFIEVRFLRPASGVIEAKRNGHHPGTFSVPFDAE